MSRRINASEQALPPLTPTDHPPSSGTTRRGFLRGAAKKAAYVTPVVAVLGAHSEALANSNDGIPWSQCGSFGESCGAVQCCPGYHCVSEPTEMCQPWNP